MTTIDTLAPGDEAQLTTFLMQHLDTSMFLLSNSREAGLVDRGRRLEATYVAAREGGRITGVAALAWNGMMLIQAPRHLPELAREVVKRAPRELVGVTGPWTQVDAARTALGFADRATKIAGQEVLFSLDLSRLQVPEALETGEVRCRKAVERDVEALIAWRVAYNIETLGEREGPALQASAREGIERALSLNQCWVLERGGERVSMSGFNAALPECVQIGGVYTPPERRGLGHGRAVVAGSLLEARADGVPRSILFTGQENAPAQRAYRALGYEAVGSYGLVLFASPLGAHQGP